MLLLTCPKALNVEKPFRYVVLVCKDNQIKILDVLVACISDLEALVCSTDWLFGWNILMVVDFQDNYLAPF